MAPKAFIHLFHVEKPGHDGISLCPLVTEEELLGGHRVDEGAHSLHIALSEAMTPKAMLLHPHMHAYNPMHVAKSWSWSFWRTCQLAGFLDTLHSEQRQTVTDYVTAICVPLVIYLARRRMQQPTLYMIWKSQGGW